MCMCGCVGVRVRVYVCARARVCVSFVVDRLRRGDRVLGLGGRYTAPRTRLERAGSGNYHGNVTLQTERGLA